MRGAFLGTRPRAFPENFAVFARFHRALSALPERHPMPDPLPLAEAERLVAEVNAAASTPEAPARPEARTALDGPLRCF